MTDTKLTEAPSRNRLGYYHTPYGKFLSVTTIIEKGVPKPALVHWAAWEAARAAVANIPMLVRARGEQARKNATIFLQGAAERIRDEAADLGTAIHKEINAHILGSAAPEPTEEQAPFVAAFRRFLLDWRPEWEATELVVAHPEDGWCGTADWWAWITLPDVGRTLVIGDTKSGKPDKKRKKSTYPEAAMQLSAYQRATVGWLRDGTEVAPPKADRAVVLHVRPDYYPDKGYALVPANTGDEVYAWFRHAQGVAHGEKTLAKDAIGEPLTPPEPGGEWVHYDGEEALCQS